MAHKILDDDAMLLAQVLGSLNLDETAGTARFMESLAFDAIFREDWERICGNLDQLHFYDSLAAGMFDALENHGDLENAMRERAGQLLREVEAQYDGLLDEIEENYEWICKHMVSMEIHRRKYKC
ncbi:hypothetical protein GN109_07830 [Collimonas pratensis]|uniref:hypothetical protein n=1 Tax=Collimonas pratensis TaxID=279113 RepID=UPI00143D5964|nr:hypothetical protein [Collimonas pratensis]NKI69323.1 hypothetical protein [Collimonas pratensis]